MSKTKSIIGQKSKRTKRNSYPLEFKESSVKLATESDVPASQIARELGINVNTLYNWIGQSSRNKKKDKNMKSSSNATHIAEIKKLKAKLARITQERDLLKKAAAYFAVESL